MNQLNFFTTAAIAEPAQLTLEDCIQLSTSKETDMTIFKTSTTVAARPKELPDLRQFSGTEHYYKAAFGYQMTDGVKHVCETAHAYWLVDVITSHIMTSKTRGELLVCKLIVDDLSNAATFTMTDGDDNVIATQEIEYTDFPAREQTIWVQNGILMLPSEY